MMLIKYYNCGFIEADNAFNALIMSNHVFLLRRYFSYKLIIDESCVQTSNSINEKHKHYKIRFKQIKNRHNPSLCLRTFPEKNLSII